jgi:DNA-binding NarL/FixJ family response regulator
VLLVEDSVLLAARLVQFIQRLLYAQVVATVDSESDAIRHLYESDVVVLDLHLRKGTGLGVLRALNGATHPKVIVLTNFSLPEYRRAAEALGAYAFLDKSRDFGRLSGLLLTFVEERRRPGG